MAITHFNKLSIWFGKRPNKTSKLFPSYSYFDGGSYFKFSFYFLNYILEFSHPKKDKTVYKKATKQELDNLLADLKKSLKSRKKQR